MPITLWVSVDFMGEEMASGFLTFNDVSKDILKTRCIQFVSEASGL